MCGGTVRRGDEDRASGVLALANKEPLVGVEPGIDIMWEVIGKDGCDGSDSMVRERETPLCHSRHWFGREGSSCTQNGDVGHSGGVGDHRGSEILSSRSGDIDVIRINGDVVVERGEKEGIKQFLSHARGSGRHCVSITTLL